MFSRLLRKLKLLVALLLTIMLLTFAAVNRDFIEISLFPLPYIIDIPKFLLAIICFSGGLIVGGIIMSLKLSRALRMAKKEHKLVMALQNEVAGIKAEQALVTS